MTSTSLRTQRFRTIYDELYADLLSYCRRRVAPDEVDDLVAETMMVVWQRLDDVPASGAARPWVYAVARNLMRNHWRKGQRAGALRDVLVSELHRAQQRDAEAGGAQALEYDQVQALVDGLHALKSKEQELIRLATWEELPHAEIALVLDCSINAVAIRLLRARSHLSQILGRDPRWTSPLDETLKGGAPVRHVGVDGRTPAGNHGTTPDMIDLPRQEGCN